jgi:predicted nucleic acid-binding protein
MKVMIDLNVLLDVLQKREPYFGASAKTLALASQKKFEACLPAHCLTTLYYITQKYAGKKTANKAIDWVLNSLKIQPETEHDFLRARALDMSDFEDAVVAAIAESAGCAAIITRNITDFNGAPVSTLTPEEFIAELYTNP